MNADGSGPTGLTRRDGDHYDAYPTCSPDGRKIAFESTRDGIRNYEVYVMNADGSGQTNLTNHAGQERLPAWSGCTKP